jgi:lipid-A-disaccharide synthase-like uncharacterized protein
MKTFFKKNWALIGFIIAFLLDQNTGFISKVVPDTYWQNFIRGLGSLLLAYFWKNQNNFLNSKIRTKPRAVKSIKDEKL